MKSVLVRALAALAAAVTALSAGIPHAASDEADTLVLARVNGETITLADLRTSFGARHAGHGDLLAGDAVIREVVARTVDDRLMIQEGRRRGLDADPEIRKATAGHKDALLLAALQRRHLGDVPAPTTAEVQAVYDLLPRQLHLALIETADRAKIDQARLRLSAGESFEAVARTLSTHPSRTRGGDLGWVTWGLLDEATESVAMKSAAGRVSEPFVVPGGYRLLKVIEEKNGDPPPLAEVSRRIAAILSARRREKQRESLIASIARTSPAVENRDAIARLLAEAPESTGDTKPEPPDEAILMTTRTGLTVTAGQVRSRANTSSLTRPAAWKAATEEALLTDEARRRIKPDAAMSRAIRAHADSAIRDRLEREVVFKDLAVTDEEVRDLFDKEAAAFSPPAIYHMRHIVRATREQAQETARLVKGGASFAQLARDTSIDAQTAGQGGDLGWLEAAPGGAAPSGVFALAAGEISGVVESGSGYAIVQMLEIRRPPAPSFEKVRHEAARRLMARKQQDLREAFVVRLRNAARITVSQQGVERAIRLQDDFVGGAPSTHAGSGRETGR